jgi:hypothetical protein
MKSRLRIKHRPAAIIETAVRKPIQRWSAARKRDIVLRVLRGGLIEAVSRQVGTERRWCTRQTPSCYAMAGWRRMESGRPAASIRFSAATPIAVSVSWAETGTRIKTKYGSHPLIGRRVMTEPLRISAMASR